MKARMKYEQPKLVSFDNDARIATGECEPGSGDSGSCADGNSAQGLLCANGPDAAQSCNIGTCPAIFCIGGSGFGTC